MEWEVAPDVDDTWRRLVAKSKSEECRCRVRRKVRLDILEIAKGFSKVVNLSLHDGLLCKTPFSVLCSTFEQSNSSLHCEKFPM